MYFFPCDTQADTAAKRIGKVLNINRDNEKMMEDYEKVASDVCIPDLFTCQHVFWFSLYFTARIYKSWKWGKMPLEGSGFSCKIMHCGLWFL